jgi:hypothetical protein
VRVFMFDRSTELLRDPRSDEAMRLHVEASVSGLNDIVLPASAQPHRSADDVVRIPIYRQ